jgi:hypothetical protein
MRLLVVGNIKWFADLVTVFVDLVFCLLETFCDKVDWLHLTDWEFSMVLGDDIWVQWKEFRLVGNTVF